MTEQAITNDKLVVIMSVNKTKELQMHHGDTMTPRVKRKIDLGDILLENDKALKLGWIVFSIIILVLC